VTLREDWELRNAAAETLIKVEYLVRDALKVASLEDVVALLEAFSPARSPGPDWTRSLDPLVEHLWLWCDPALLAEAEANFRGRGAGWGAVANALQADHGAELLRKLEQRSAPSRLPPFTLG
jgi:hypothetical protein